MEPPREDMENIRHPETLHNRTPSSVAAIYTGLIQFLQQYGWLVLLGLIVLFFIKQKLQSILATRPFRRSSEQDLHRYDSETALKRQEGFEASRRRLQEKMDADSALFAEEQKKKDEEKRKLKIADWENHLQGKGYRSKYKPPEQSTGPSSSSGPSTATSQKKKPTYRTSDYNPLTGGGGSGGGSYRPSARRGGGG